MSDAFSEVLDAFAAAAGGVTGITTLVVDPADSLPEAKLPGLEIRSGAFEPLPAETGRDGWRWELIVSLGLTGGDDDALKAALRAKLAETAKLLLADPTLGGKACNVVWTGGSDLYLSEHGRYVASIDLTFEVDFETDEDDPTSLI